MVEHSKTVGIIPATHPHSEKRFFFFFFFFFWVASVIGSRCKCRYLVMLQVRTNAGLGTARVHTHMLIIVSPKQDAEPLRVQTSGSRGLLCALQSRQGHGCVGSHGRDAKILHWSNHAGVTMERRHKRYCIGSASPAAKEVWILSLRPRV
jgi:hypothetical protein